MRASLGSLYAGNGRGDPNGGHETVQESALVQGFTCSRVGQVHVSLSAVD